MIYNRCKIFIILLILFSSIYAKNDPIEVARQPKNNFDYMETNSNLIILPYDDWSIKGSWSSLGLPAYTSNIYYNGLKSRDPLFGSMPIGWFNFRNTQSQIQSNQITISPNLINSKNLYSKFDYYQGDYGFKNFSLITGKKVSKKYSWTFYGNNVGYDGGYGLYGPYYKESGESIIQNYHLDCTFNRKNWQTKAGFAYKKYRPGLLKYTESFYTADQKMLAWQNDGNFQEWKVNNYIIFRHNAPDSLVIGADFANYFYRYNYENFQFRGEGRSISAKLQRNVAILGQNLRFKFEPLLQKAYFKHHSPKMQNTVTTQLQYSASVLAGKLSISAGAANLTPIYDIHYKTELWRKLNIEFQSKRSHFNYPLIYFAPLLNKKCPDDEDTYFVNSISLEYKNPNLYSKSTFAAISAKPYSPFKMSVKDSATTFTKTDLPTQYWLQNLRLNLPWQAQLDCKIAFSPQASDNFFQLYSYADYSQSLSPIFSTAADLMPSWLGFFENYFNQLAHNMTSYLSFNSYYMQGGESLFWFQEFQNLGKISTNYFTNDKFNINFKFGFQVESFHIFYALYNMEDRQFSTIGGMPYHNRLQVIGVEWAFLD